MAETNHPNPKPNPRLVRKLRTIQDLIEAGEWMFNKQEAGQLDAKAADALNTTLKRQSKFVVDTPMALLKIWVRAQEKKFVIPSRMLPPGMTMEQVVGE